MASELYVNTIAEKTPANGVSVDGVTLKDGGATLTGDFVPATPLSHRNMIINGGMQVWQRATAATAATTTYDTVDRWRLYENTDGAYTSEKHTMALAELNTTGHRTALKLACTIADANIASGQYSYFYTALEGQNCQHMQYGTANAKNITISFWVKSNKTGIYNISIYNDAATNYQVSKNYTISSADTWEQKKITITPTEGSTSLITGSGGLIANDNAQAILLYFGLAWGSSLSSSAVDTWVVGGTAYGNSSQVNWMEAGNTFYITGVQLELGSSATPFEHRSYGDELARCQRYYQTGGSSGDGARVYLYTIDQDNTYRRGMIFFKRSMRSAPTLTVTGVGGYQWAGTEHSAVYTNGVASGNSDDVTTWVATAEL